MRFLHIGNIFSLANKITCLLFWMKCIPTFILAQRDYSTNIPIYLTLFPNPFTNRRSPFLLVNITFFFWHRLLFCFFVFTGCFNLKFIFYLVRFNLVFVGFCIFFVSFHGPVAVFLCKVEVDFQIFSHVDS